MKNCSYRYAKLKITYVVYRRCFRRKPNWLCLSHIYNPYQQSETLPNTGINPNLWYHVVPWDNIVELNFSSSIYKLNVCTCILYFPLTHAHFTDSSLICIIKENIYNIIWYIIEMWIPLLFPVKCNVYDHKMIWRDLLSYSFNHKLIPNIIF